MLFDQGNRSLSFNKGIDQSDYYVEHIEVLPASDGNSESDIEKRFKEPLKELSKAQKELNSLSKEMKHRMREVRKNNGDELDYEKDMFKTRASVIDSKIKISDKKARIIKDMLSTELKDKKFQQDASGIGKGSNNPDMRGHYARYFNDGASQNGGLNGAFLSNPESHDGRSISDGNDSPPPRPNNNQEETNNTPKPKPKSRPNKSKQRSKKKTLNNEDLDDLQRQYGLDYQGAASNLRNKDENFKEVMHIDPDRDVYWLEIYDDEGNIVDDARRKHIEQLGAIEVDESENVIRDEFNNTYEFVEDEAENMREMYVDQWQEKGELEEF